LVFAAFVAGGAFAQVQLSAGGGFVFDGGRVGGLSLEAFGESFSEHINHFGFGGFAFLDATFAELSFGFMGGPARFGWEVSWPGGSESDTMSGSFLALDFSLLGKFPIVLGGGNMTFFPMLGIGYNVVLSSRDEDGNDNFERSDDSATELNTFRIQFGIGGDIDLSDTVFFRGSILGQYRFAPSLYRDIADGRSVVPGLSVDHHGGFGVSVRLAIGVRF